MPSIPELQQRAIEYAKSGDFGAQALATNLELAKMAPTNEGALTRLSRCYMEGGQLDEATATLDAALQINPQNTIARSLQLEVTKRRVASTPVDQDAAHARTLARASGQLHRIGRPLADVTRRSAGGRDRTGRIRGARDQLAPEAAVESLGSRIEPLLMALNERPFAAKAVETRNRAGQSGARLFRRHTIHSGGAGHLRVFHQGARWEPQLTIGLFSSTPWGRDAVCAGIGFKLTPERSDSDQERALAHFAQFQQLVVRRVARLSHAVDVDERWIHPARRHAAVDRPPAERCARVADQLPASGDRVAGSSSAAGCSSTGRRMRRSWPTAAGCVAWIDSSFTDLLPMWTSLYRS